jgi:Na+-driven multidrug efflux pump
MNFAAALSTFVGQNLGANKPERIKRGLLATLRMTALISISISTIAFLFSEELINVFTSDQNVILIGSEYLQIVSPFYIIFTTMFVIGAIMRGAGDTLVPMIITFLALWVVRIPACYYLAQQMGETGIWWGIPLAWFTGAALSFIYYLTGRWKSKVVVKHST